MYSYAFVPPLPVPDPMPDGFQSSRLFSSGPTMKMFVVSESAFYASSLAWCGPGRGDVPDEALETRQSDVVVSCFDRWEGVLLQSEESIMNSLAITMSSRLVVSYLGVLVD